MQIDFNQILRAAVVIIVGGIILLGFTYLATFLLPLISIAVVIFVLYLLYRWYTTGSMRP